MRVEHLRVGRLSVAEAVKLINEHTEGRNVHSIFFEPRSLISGVLEIKTTEIQHCIMKVEKPVKSEAKRSKYRGVSWDKSLNKWRARIMVNGKRISLGVYDDIDKAAEAYDLAALRFLGGKAKLNLMYVIDETKYEVLAKDNKGITHGLRKDVK